MADLCLVDGERMNRNKRRRNMIEKKKNQNIQPVRKSAMLPAQFFALKSACQEVVSAAQTNWHLTRCVDAVVVSGT